MILLFILDDSYCNVSVPVSAEIISVTNLEINP